MPGSANPDFLVPSTCLLHLQGNFSTLMCFRAVLAHGLKKRERIPHKHSDCQRWQIPRVYEDSWACLLPTSLTLVDRCKMGCVPSHKDFKNKACKPDGNNQVILVSPTIHKLCVSFDQSALLTPHQEQSLILRVIQHNSGPLWASPP